MNKDRKVICDIISKMLDNPDKYGIYPTTKAYDELEDYVQEIRMETLGWIHADACCHLDKKIDYRTIECPSIAKRALLELCKEIDNSTSRGNCIRNRETIKKKDLEAMKRIKELLNIS